jgi:hypothetical protein
LYSPISPRFNLFSGIRQSLRELSAIRARDVLVMERAPLHPPETITPGAAASNFPSMPARV